MRKHSDFIFLVKRIAAAFVILLFFVTYKTVQASELTDMIMIESFLSGARDSLQDYGIDITTDELWVGNYIPSYELVEGTANEISNIRQYPVFDSSGNLKLFAIVFEKDGINVSLSSAFITDINRLRENSRQTFSFIYSSNSVFLRITTTLFLLSECDYSVPGRDVVPDNYNGDSLVCIGRQLLPSYRLVFQQLSPDSIMDESDYSAYVSAPVIRQPSGSNWCWAASMASVVNYELGTSYTCTSMANNYTTNTEEFANLAMIQNRLYYDFSILYYTVTNGNLLTVLNSIGEGHPIIGAFGYQIPNTNYWLGHSVVIRGINLESLYISIMDPSPNSSGNYTTCSIYNFNSSTSVGTVYYVSPTTGLIYTLSAYIYYVVYYG